MAWLYYLLEANLYLLIFYWFYRLFLQSETFYNSNRYYLLLTSLTAFLLPILQLGLLKPLATAENLVVDLPLGYGEATVTDQSVNTVQETINYADFLYPVYLFIALCFAIKLTLAISKIINLWLTAKTLRTGEVTLVELHHQAAFSFFNLLFIHPHLAKKQTVLNHEMVHIRQKHSFDILFFEILQIISWFNPILYFIKKDIKLLHEYIADELSTGDEMQKHEYAMFLIENSFGVTPTALTNQIFNQSILKRRINMLNKKRTAGWARLKLLIALPLAGGMLCMSTMAFTKDYGYVDLLPEKSISISAMMQHTVKVENVKRQAVKAENIKKEALPKARLVSSTKVRDANRNAQDHFYPLFTKDARTKVIKPVDKRYVLINTKKVEDMSTFYGVKNTQKVVYFNSKEAIKKYGADAKYGAVEISGSNIKWLSFSEMPPPPLVDMIRFAPPKSKSKKPDSVRIVNLRVKPDSVRPINIKLRTVAPVKSSTVAPIRQVIPLRKATAPTRSIQIKRKPDTVNATLYREVRVTEQPLVHMQRPARKGDVDSATRVTNKKAGDQVIEVKLLPSTKTQKSKKAGNQLNEVRILKPDTNN